MITSRLRAWLTYFTPGVVPSAGAADTSAISVDEALKAEEARYTAQLGNDFLALQKLFGEDLIYTHSSALVDTKKSFIEALRSGSVKYRGMKHGDLKVRTFGSVAIITGQCNFEVSVKGEDRSLALFFHSIWAKRGGAIEFVSWQSTRLTQ